MNPDEMTHRALSWLVRELTMLIDSGRHDAVTVADARAHIRSGDALAWLKELDSRVDVSLFGPDGPNLLAGREWIESFDRQLNAYSMRDDFGIEKRGLCMFLTLTVDQLRMEVDRVLDAANKRILAAEGPPPEPSMH